MRYQSINQSSGPTIGPLRERGGERERERWTSKWSIFPAIEPEEGRKRWEMDWLINSVFQKFVHQESLKTKKTKRIHIWPRKESKSRVAQGDRKNTETYMQKSPVLSILKLLCSTWLPLIRLTCSTSIAIVAGSVAAPSPWKTNAWSPWKALKQASHPFMSLRHSLLWSWWSWSKSPTFVKQCLCQSRHWQGFLDWPICWEAFQPLGIEHQVHASSSDYCFNGYKIQYFFIICLWVKWIEGIEKI